MKLFETKRCGMLQLAGSGKSFLVSKLAIEKFGIGNVLWISYKNEAVESMREYAIKFGDTSGNCHTIHHSLNLDMIGVKNFKGNFDINNFKCIIS